MRALVVTMVLLATVTPSLSAGHDLVLVSEDGQVSPLLQTAMTMMETRDRSAMPLATRVKRKLIDRKPAISRYIQQYFRYL